MFFLTWNVSKSLKDSLHSMKRKYTGPKLKRVQKWQTVRYKNRMRESGIKEKKGKERKTDIEKRRQKERYSKKDGRKERERKRE